MNKEVKYLPVRFGAPTTFEQWSAMIARQREEEIIAYRARLARRHRWDRVPGVRAS